MKILLEHGMIECNEKTYYTELKLSGGQLIPMGYLTVIELSYFDEDKLVGKIQHNLITDTPYGVIVFCREKRQFNEWASKIDFKILSSELKMSITDMQSKINE